MTAKRNIPWLAVQCALLALVAFAIGVVFSLYVNPEVTFWKSAVEHKVRVLKTVQSENPAANLFVGGSSTAFGIDAAALSANGYPSVNLGLPAGAGLQAILGIAATKARPGDTVFACLEPGILVGEHTGSALGTQIARATSMPEILSWADPQPSPWTTFAGLSDLRPGINNLLVFALKKAAGKPLYRYSPEDLRAGGLIATDVRNPLHHKSTSGKLPFSEHSKEILKKLAALSKAKGFSVYYLLPWEFVQSENAEAARAQNAEFLLEIAQCLPVAREPELGVWSEPTLFSDSHQHLTEEGARFRSLRLQESLKAQLATTPR